MYGMNHHIDIQTCINEDPRICGVRPQFPKLYIPYLGLYNAQDFAQIL